jgi:hypothetical protein
LISQRDRTCPRERGVFPLSFAAAKTQVLSNRFQTEIEKKKERKSVQDIWIE